MSDEREPLRVIGGAPTDEEAAAIAAVFTQLALERAASARPLPRPAARSGWARSARSLRGPLWLEEGPPTR